VAVEPRPHPGTSAGAAAGPAGRAVASPYATAAALSNAPGITGRKLQAALVLSSRLGACDIAETQDDASHYSWHMSRRVIPCSLRSFLHSPLSCRSL
jgi:hypothetical protein